MTRLPDDQVRSRIPEGWWYDGGAIRKEFTFPGFRAAIAFIDRIADVAHAAKHHPELVNNYNRVVVVLTTHDEGGVTERDLDLADAIESVVEPQET